MGYLLNRPAFFIRERAQELLKPLGLIPPHFGVMATLASEGPQTQRALGKMLRVDPTTMVWIIDHLEKAGFVRRGMHPEDRRAHLVQLSPAGKSIHQQAAKRLDKLDEEFLAPLSKAEQAVLRRLLIKLFQNVVTQSVSPAQFKKDAE